MKKETTDFFTQELAERYDDRNSKLAPISENLHFLIRKVLEELPEKAKVLSVGAGTGVDIISLAKAYSDWTFVAVEPSLAMLNVCRQRIEEAGLTHRCEFVHGYSQDVSAQENFDAVLSILVAHFVESSDRLNFYKSLVRHLKKGGILVNAEICYDLESKNFPLMLTNWKAIQKMMGATPESLASLPKQLKEMLTILPPKEVESLFVESGIDSPIQFFQAFMISAWYGIKH
ncbi:MAG: class I SAM-dependent methyltransferase [Bdellovibrionales bacterium]|nr:class I SAM-dependent methyltransferase [Bdellovibrionales bacterium]